MYYLIALALSTLFCVQYSESCAVAEHIKKESGKITKSKKYPVRIVVHTHKQGIYIIDRKAPHRFQIRGIPKNSVDMIYHKSLSSEKKEIETITLNLEAVEKEHILKLDDFSLLERNPYTYPLIYISDFCRKLRPPISPGLRKIQQINEHNIRISNAKKYGDQSTLNFRGKITDIEIKCDSINIETDAQESLSIRMNKYEE